MNREDIRTRVLQCLGGVAPDADLDALDPRADLRRELDLDSMDMLHFVVALHGAFGVEVPEAHYREVATVAGCVDYLAERLAPAV